MLPSYDKLMVPVLKFLETGKAIQKTDMYLPLSKYFGLDESELALEYESGNGNIFKDRTSWALSYLYKSSLINRISRGVYQITEKGVDYLHSKQEDEIVSYAQKSVQGKLDTSKNPGEKKKPGKVNASKNNSSLAKDRTPDEDLEASIEMVKASVYKEILDTILSKTPYEFEILVIKLLQKMGYGGKISNSGERTPLSNDGGIDGIIKEDILGFNNIYIQAKRYSPELKVGRKEVQSFVGAVSGTPSKKGIFITTSDFNNNVIDYVKTLSGNPSIILMNGDTLVKYIYDYGLGMQVKAVYEIKSMDTDFWEEMTDDTSYKKDSDK